MLWPFVSGYTAKLPVSKFESIAHPARFAGKNEWGAFMWDYIPYKEYSSAPENYGVPESVFKDKAPLLVSAVAMSTDRKKVLKLEFLQHFRKRNSLANEAAIIKKLNRAGCISAPRLVEDGSYSYEDIIEHLPADVRKHVTAQGRKAYDYLVIEYVPSGREAPLPDIILAMLEQKSLGVYHMDVKPENIRFDETRGVCIFIDFDQAEELQESVIKMNGLDFLGWCDKREKENRPQFDTWRRHFKGLEHDRHIKPMFSDGAFNLALTTPYRRQATTNTKNGVYHTISSPVVYANGVRDLKDRALLLNKVEFSQKETVLDVGCNAGLLCHYLAGRGCSPTGIELDSFIVNAAKMVANILGVNSQFMALDLDCSEIPGKFDTVCLFSVIHHTRNLKENGRKIAQNCDRILIECKLAEHGRKPVKGLFGGVKWVATSIWDYPDETALSEGLSELFPGFVVDRKVGKSDKSRILLEMKKL